MKSVGSLHMVGFGPDPVISRDDRVGPPPFNKAIWREGSRDYTTCGYCNRLIYVEHGPVCGICKTARKQAKSALRRNKRKGGAA